jgi:hypothetical protein
MKKLIIHTIVCLLLCSCLINKNQASYSGKQTTEALRIDTLERAIRISTESYWRDYKKSLESRLPVGMELEQKNKSKQGNNLCIKFVKAKSGSGIERF